MIQYYYTAHSSMMLKATQCKGKLIEFYNHKHTVLMPMGSVVLQTIMELVM